MIEQLRQRAREKPDQKAFVFLRDGEDELASLTFAELDRRARSAASRLTELARPGDRAVLAYPQGLDFIVALFACFYAGLVAVPASSPSRDLDGLRQIARDSDARCLLSSGRLVEAIGQELRSDPALTQLICTRTDDWTAEDGPDPGWTPDSTALLLYTSGATGPPRGVAVHYAHLLNSVRQLRQALAENGQESLVSCLPPHYEMGLGSLFLAVELGAPCIVLPPPAVQQKPQRWLKALSRYRSTISGGPSSLYRLCAQLSAEQRQGLDLSAWRVAYCGGEAPCPEALESFSKAFTTQGFRPAALRTLYTLAEAALWVSLSPSGAALRVTCLGDQPEKLRRVGCGRPPAETRLLIVDPDSLTPSGPGQIGEIWLASDSVAAGYWGRPQDSASAFEGHLANGSGPFLRTGDLGFLDQDELFIAGRLANRILMRGQAHYPEDLEASASASHPGLEPNGAAVFFHDDKLVVVCEVSRAAQRDLEAGTLVRAIRRALVEAHLVNTHTVVLVKPSGLPRTPTGKLRRYACQQAYLEQSLSPLASWDFWAEASPLATIAVAAQPAPSPEPVASPGEDFWQGLAEELREQLTQVMSVKTFADGEAVFHEGDLAGGLFVVMEGEAVVEKQLDPDRFEILGIVSPGGVFGEMTLFGEAGRSATVRSRGTLRTLHLGRDEFRSFLVSQPESAAQILGALLSLVSSRMREATQCLMTLRETGRLLGMAVDIPELCQSVLERVVKALPAEGAVIALLEGGRFTPVVGFGLPPELSVPFALEPALINELILRSEGLRLGPANPKVAFLGYRWCLLTELQHEERLLGLVGVLSNQEQGPFTRAHSVMLAVVANQAASSVAHARLRASSPKPDLDGNGA